MYKDLKKTYAKKYLLFYLPFIFVLGIVPLIVKMAVRENPLQGVAWYSQGQTIVDFFLYWKSVILILSALAMLILLVYYVADRSFRLQKQDMILVPVLILTFFEIASSLFSVNSKTTLHGMPDQFESVWVLLAYSVCLIYAYMCLSWDVVKIEMITCIMLVCAFPIELICVGQAFGQDIFRYIYSGEGYTFNFALGEAYGTFYNKNYVGSYAVLLIPCFVVAAICAKKVWIKVIAVIETIMLLISLYGSASSTGVIAFLVVLVLFLIILFVRIIPTVKYKKVILFLIMLFMVLISTLLA